MLASKRVMSRDAALALDLDSRIKLEEQITDAKASKIPVPNIPNDWTFSDHSEEYPWSSYEFGFLGPLTGKSIIDIGCGYHPTPIYFALAGARRVCACDVSPKAVQFMRRLANIYGAQARRAGRVQGSARTQPYPRIRPRSPAGGDRQERRQGHGSADDD